MKRVKIKIAHQDGKAEIEAYQVDNRCLFAVHRVYLDSNPKDWILTHVPTGLRILDYPTLKRASAVGLKLLTIPGIDWSQLDGSYYSLLGSDQRDSIKAIVTEEKPFEPINYSKPKKETIPENYIRTNDIKKGDSVILRDGSLVIVEDSKKGITRMISCKSRFDMTFSKGSAYVFDWYSWKPAGNGMDAKRVHFTADQIRKRDRIAKSGIQI